VSGIATFTSLTITGSDGNVTLSFNFTGLTSAIPTSATNVQGPPSQLVITTQPSTATVSGVALSTQPVLTVEDASGNAVTTATGYVTAAITSGSGALVNPSALITNGVATFSGLTVTGLAGSYTLSFTDSTGGLAAMTMPGASNTNWSSVTFGNGEFVAVVNGSNVAAYSTNGTTWTTTTLPASQDWESVTYGNGEFVAVGYGTSGGTTVAAYSTDGINWTASTMPSSQNWRSVAYGGGEFLAVTYGANSAAYSTNGTTWTALTLPSSSDWEDLAYGNGTWVTVSYTNGYSNIAYSTNGGSTWSTYSYGTAESWASVTFGNGMFVAMTIGNVLLYSTNGSTWTYAAQPGGGQFFAVTFGDGEFFGLDTNTNIYTYSVDGVHWYQSTLPTSKWWNSLAFGNGLFVGTSNSSGALATQLFSTSASITVTPGGATQLVLATQPSASATNGVALATQPVVDVEDVSGNLVTSATGSVTATVSTGTGALANATVAISNGVATFTGLTLNGLVGNDTLSFTDTGLTSAVATSATALAVGSPAKLVIITQPSTTATNGVALVTQPVVGAQDAGGNTVTSATGTVTATVSTGSGTLTNATATFTSGVATFTGLTLNGLVGNDTLSFTDTGLTSAVATSATALAVGSPAKLVITTQPSTTATNGVALATQPVVDAQDAGGNTVTSATGTVTATVSTGSGTLTNATATFTSGVATFSGLTITGLIGNDTLTFSATGLTSATASSATTLAAGSATQLVITTQPSTSASSGVVLTTQPVVTAEDASGNPVTTAVGTVTATVTTGTGTLTNASATLNNGVATFSGLVLTDMSGSDVLTFSDSPYTSATATIAVTAAPRPVVILPPVAVVSAPVVTPTSGFQKNNVSVIADYAPATSTTSYTATSASTATQGVHVTLGNVMTIALANGYSVVLIKNAGVAPALLASDLLANSYVTVRTTTGMKLQTLIASAAGSLNGKLLFASLPLGVTNLVVQGANQQGQEFELTTNVYIAAQLTVVSSNIAPHAVTLPTSTLSAVTQLVKSAMAQTLLQVTVDSYTSNVGSAANNLAISQQQATAEKGFISARLSSQGITNVNFVATGMGGTSPIASNATAAGRAKNGRVAVTVIEA
jgi:hypothetical protein